jgi:tubulin-specific chaperone A
MSHNYPFFNANFTENQYLMAKTISDEKMKLSIVIDGNEAQKELLDLEKSTRELTKSNKELLIQKKALTAQGKTDTAEFKALTAEIKANSTTLNANKTKMAELQDQIGLTGLTMKQLGDKAKLLRMQLLNAIPGGEAYTRYTEELKQVSTRMDELKGKAGTARMSIGSLADSFNRYQGLAISAIAGLTGVALSIQKIIDINGKLSDAQTDVMKTTGQTKEEVDELTKSFGLLQTRTSRIDLLGIAEQGGRIGIAKAEIGDFVNVMNKASVALGDSFTGGAEEVAEKLGKIKFLFAQTKDLNVEESYNAIGSAINDLGANGVASEASIAEFTTRMGSLTDVLKPTIQETLAMGTAFEESGIEAEVSSRAYGIFMKQASTESAKFGKVMGISQKEVEKLINTNPLEFMLNFAKGMKGMDATETAKTLDFLGINADGANKVIGAMGNNMGRFRELIDLSNNSFASGTSLINEYNIKNNNLAATLEKISKTISGWFSSETFIKWLGGAVNWLAKFIGATEDADGSVTAWKNTLVFIAKVFAIVTAAMITNVGWQKLVALWTTRSAEANLLYVIGAKARAFADGVATAATSGYAVITNLLRLNTIGAAVAFRTMTAAMMATPWGFILGAVAAIGTAYYMFAENAKEAETSQSMLNKNMKDADAIVKEQTISMNSLLAVAQDETASKGARLAAIKKLNEISPEYLKSLTLENIKTAEGKKLIDAYVQSLQKKAMMEVLVERQKALTKQISEKQGMSLEEEITWFDQSIAYMKNLGNASLASADVIVGASARKQQAIAKLQSELKLTNAEMSAFLKKNPNAIADLGGDTSGGSDFIVAPGGGGGTGTGSATKKNPNSTIQEINRLKLESNTKFNDLLLKQQRQAEDDRILIMEDGYAKDLAIENQRYKKEIDELNRQKVHSEELAKMDEEIAKAKEAKDTVKYNALLEIKKGWAVKNDTLDAQINQVIEGKQALHNLKIGTIEEKAAKELIENEQEAYEIAKAQRETNFLNELAGLDVSDEEKKKRQQSFDNKELAIQKEFIRKKIADFKKIIEGGIVNGIDFSLLSPEAKVQMLKDVAFLELAAAKIETAKDPRKKSKAENIGDAAKGAFGETDILGYTPAQWESAFNNLDSLESKFIALNMVVGGMQQLWAGYNQFVTANENSQFQRFETNSNSKKKRLKQQLDSGAINQEQYSKQVQKIDDDLAKKKADLDYKQAKREKQMALVGAIISTAKGVASALPNLVLAGIAGILGAFQIATIAKQPLPAKGFEQGLYPEYVKRQQDNKVFKSTFGGKTKSGLVKDTTHFMVAENGPEMVIDNKAWTQMNPALKDSLVRELQGIKGFEEGLYNESLKRYEVPATTTPGTSTDSQMLSMVLKVIADNTAVMKDIKESGILAIVSAKDFNSMKNLKEGLKKYDALRNDNKQ